MPMQFIKRKIQQFRDWLSPLNPDEAGLADDFDQMRAWSISAQLAAVPAGYLQQVPLEVATLIRAAKKLHPAMAAGAAERDARGEACPAFG